MTIHSFISLFIICTLALCLSACDNSGSVKSICTATPSFCNDLNQDGWCRREKADLIRTRANFAGKPTDRQRYHLLKSFHKYKACIELVAVIEPKKKKEKKTTRVMGLLTAINEIERLSKETKNSNDPYLLLYHWTYNSNQQAGEKFLSMQNTPALEEPKLLQALAYHYSNYNVDLSISILKHAISLYKKDEPYPESIFETMTTMQLQANQYERAYVWAIVAKKMGSKQVDKAMIERYQTFDKALLKQIDNKAEALLDKIKSHQYRPPLPTYSTE